ncbi:signal recognition particle receptor subunit alpha homolog [Daphnia carinata]|uniref:signal recognition particle receptor subunit alpha homolog n=1 Tax=Daphnia carinata TaxID=120202 RepID=UPI00257D508A|nr:signal recognition particle receptor subunit alpha homolog [Daphnia carinata]
MLDFFSIFSKGGIVLWCFQGTSQIFTSSVNALIKAVILQERTGQLSYDHDNVTLKYKLDNEFELVYVVAYQKILKLSYVDKFLNDINMEFRDAYKNELQLQQFGRNFEISEMFTSILKSAEEWGRAQALAPRAMKSFEESQKSKKTVASMIERKGDDKENKKVKKVEIKVPDVKIPEPINVELSEEDLIQQKRREFAEKMAAGKNKSKPTTEKLKSPKAASKKSKESRVWPLGGAPKDMETLDYTRDKDLGESPLPQQAVYLPDPKAVGTLQGEVRDMDFESESEEEEDVEERGKNDYVPQQVSQQKKKTGIFSLFKNLVGSKTISEEDMAPVLDKMRDHLIAKNVASEIAGKLCDSVAAKLNGKVLGTFESLANTVKASLTESLVQILSPRRRVDILRDVYESQRQKRPYVMSFCGVNGVGKSTNLAKICFWLVENNFRVLIAACDTFRAGAVEQLRTHMRHLNSLHPAEKHGGLPMVQLYEKGYGKDAAGIALEAINHAQEAGIDVVMIDTAGRMQDNEPLMRALAKLIKVNEPDLVLFVGEALVGNEAVDQLVKFNQALADYSASENPHTIDGIVLTKFDTIDDKVGAAISMTYITGQPIVFIGTGQTYADLKTLNVKAVVSILMK